MYDDDLLLGFPVPPLIRFVGNEEAFLSNANGGARIFFNLEDHQSYQTGRPNLKFDVRLYSIIKLQGSAIKTGYNLPGIVLTHRFWVSYWECPSPVIKSFTACL